MVHTRPPTIANRQKVEQVKSYFSAVENPHNPLHEAVKDTKGYRLGWASLGWVQHKTQESILASKLADRAQANQGVRKVPKPILASLWVWDSPARKWPAGKTVRGQASHSRKQQTTRPHNVHWWLSHQRPVRVGLHCHCQARCDYQCTIHEDSAAYTVSTSSLTVTHVLRWTALSGDSQSTHATILTEWKSLWQNVKSGMGTQAGMCQWLTSTLENSCGWVYWPGHAGVKENVWADRLAGKAALTLSQVACFSAGLKCWEAWDITCRHKAKDITPLVAWRREGKRKH